MPYYGPNMPNLSAASWNPQTNPNQNMVLTPRPGMLNGRIINSPNDIRPNEVSMDGLPSVFPMGDGSCVYVKYWDANGMIQTICYRATQPQQTNQNQGTPDISTRLDNIEKLLLLLTQGKNQQNNESKQQNNNKRKESTANE